jgi:cytochrome c5
LRLSFSTVILTALVSFGLTAVALPPGTDDEISERLKPHGTLSRVDAAADTGEVVAKMPLTGEEVYGQYCLVCHANGVGGSPLFADTDAWAPRAAKGMDALMVSTLNGIGAMPAKGTCMSCSDDELADAVTYILDAAR